GLTGMTLRTGGIDPLDWLLSSGMALIMLLLLVSRGGALPRPRHIVWLWSLVALPALLFCLMAGITRPWLGMALLAAGLALAAGGGAVAQRLTPGKWWRAMAALSGAVAVVSFAMASWRSAE